MPEKVSELQGLVLLLWAEQPARHCVDFFQQHFLHLRGPVAYFLIV